MTYNEMGIYFGEQVLIGEEITSCKINGHMIELKTKNGFVFVYYASDGGYSTWHIDLEEE